MDRWRKIWPLVRTDFVHVTGATEKPDRAMVAVARCPSNGIGWRSSWAVAVSRRGFCRVRGAPRRHVMEGWEAFRLVSETVLGAELTRVHAVVLQDTTCLIIIWLGRHKQTGHPGAAIEVLRMPYKDKISRRVRQLMTDIPFCINILVKGIPQFPSDTNGS